ncbi:Hsp20/alpha crystallin family protein [Aspergillus clavatus NRRL 1]|uniref:Heat shock protein Hsp30/Hsp42, putative n=1 Tax=Aspergillus clavatus (strain ATCC 1007 / CBS 513.65 / DSM 816 / NCTC 3887 / NRRL 1 / QM 1276 / 107) TaxID=344612 RepID=A1CLF4_ASPCL|nr:heat shock protein Hsp30/Hsp42, putative [Aspergillus clavatus NRRL 1]EAW09978.1 heat shock protein Hsp30/Hsp42, putative [Aspergillus clavatus NRRL 1]
MSLFRTFHTPGDFSPLFRLLDDYDVHRSSKGQTSAGSSFAPRFDVRESKDAYILDGELPGIAQKDIDIEFTDSETLVVKGRTEREYHAGSPDESSEESSKKSSDKKENTEVAQTGEKQVSKSDENKHRYWVTERSVGEFHRSFQFPTPIDQDNVKASLKNGVLSITVPKKAAPTGAKKISIE